MKEEIFEYYCRSVCHRFNLSYKDLFGKSKIRNVVDARYLLFYLCHQRPMRIRDIQQFMSERGYSTEHTTIMYGLKRVTSLVKNDTDYKVLIKELKEHVIQPEGSIRPS